MKIPANNLTPRPVMNRHLGRNLAYIGAKYAVANQVNKMAKEIKKDNRARKEQAMAEETLTLDDLEYILYKSGLDKILDVVQSWKKFVEVNGIDVSDDLMNKTQYIEDMMNHIMNEAQKELDNNGIEA